MCLPRRSAYRILEPAQERDVCCRQPSGRSREDAWVLCNCYNVIGIPRCQTRSYRIFPAYCQSCISPCYALLLPFVTGMQILYHYILDVCDLFLFYLFIVKRVSHISEETSDFGLFSSVSTVKNYEDFWSWAKWISHSEMAMTLWVPRAEVCGLHSKCSSKAQCRTHDSSLMTPSGK